jgi:hypothetical protein
MKFPKSATVKKTLSSKGSQSDLELSSQQKQLKTEYNETVTSRC